MALAVGVAWPRAAAAQVSPHQGLSMDHLSANTEAAGVDQDEVQQLRARRAKDSQDSPRRNRVLRDHDATIQQCSRKLQRVQDADQRARLMLSRGVAYLRLGDSALALADFEQVLQLEPSCVDALYYRGCVLEKQGHVHEAIAEYTQVLTMDPNYVKAWYSRGACRNAIGDLVQAIEDYNNALERDKRRETECSVSISKARHSKNHASRFALLSSADGPASTMSAQSLSQAPSLDPTNGAQLGTRGSHASSSGTPRSLMSDVHTGQPAACQANIAALLGLSRLADSPGKKRHSAAGDDSSNSSDMAAPGHARQGSCSSGSSVSAASAPAHGAPYDHQGHAWAMQESSTKPRQQQQQYGTGHAEHSTSANARHATLPAHAQRPFDGRDGVDTARGKNVSSTGQPGTSGRSAVAPAPAGQRAQSSYKQQLVHGPSATSGMLHDESYGHHGPVEDPGTVGCSSGSSGGGHTPTEHHASVEALAHARQAAVTLLSGQAGLGPMSTQQQRDKPGGAGSGTRAGSSAANDSRSRQVEQHHTRGLALRRQGQYQAAVDEYTRALQLDPRHFKSLFNRGFSYDKMGDYQRAVADYSAAIESEPRNSFAHYNRGITRDRLGDFAGAIEDFSAAIALDRNSADFYHNRGFSYRKEGMLEAAISDYTQAIELNPCHCRAYYNRAFCHDRLGHNQEAILDYTRALELEPGNATAYHNRGSLYERVGRVDEALEDFGAAIQSDHSCAVSYHSRATLLQAANRLQEAMADFDAAVHLAPGSASFYRSRAQCRRALGDETGCISDLSAAIALDPADVLSLTQRGHAFRRLGELEAAIQDYSHALELAPGNVKVFNNRAYCYAKLGCFHEAVNDYNHVLELEPDNVHAIHNRGISLDKLGLVDAAVQDFNTVLTLEGRH